MSSTITVQSDEGKDRAVTLRNRARLSAQPKSSFLVSRTLPGPIQGLSRSGGAIDA